MDVGTIVTALFVIAAFALFLVLMRRLPPAEDDVAAVVAAIVGTPVELESAACGPRGPSSVADRPAQAARGRPVDAT